jgi:hypothetical protein
MIADYRRHASVEMLTVPVTGLHDRDVMLTGAKSTLNARLDGGYYVTVPDDQAIFQVRRIEHRVGASRTYDEFFGLLGIIRRIDGNMLREDRKIIEGGDSLGKFFRITQKFVDSIGIKPQFLAAVSRSRYGEILATLMLVIST